MEIDRAPPSAPGRSGGSAAGVLVWACATASDKSKDIQEQTRSALDKLDIILQGLGTNRNQLASVQIFLAKMSEKSAMDAIWCDWIGPEPKNWPQRICIGACLNGSALIEIQAVAVREPAKD